MNDKNLDDLVKNGTIESYLLENVDENGVLGQVGKMRNTEQLVLNFPNGSVLIIDTMCSGCMEDTTMSFTNICKEVEMLGHNPITIHKLNLVKSCLESALNQINFILNENKAGNVDPNNETLISMIEDALLILKKDKKPVMRQFEHDGIIDSKTCSGL